MNQSKIGHFKCPSKRRSSFGRPGQQRSTDHHPLNLTGALVDLVNLRVPHQFLHGVFRIESVAAEDLEIYQRFVQISQLFATNRCSLSTHFNEIFLSIIYSYHILKDNN